ncbi:MAG: hypothetical protein ACI4RN_01550 [Oscillospiraceae bacterium]
MRKLKDYKPTKFMAEDSHYDKNREITKLESFLEHNQSLKK